MSSEPCAVAPSSPAHPVATGATPRKPAAVRFDDDTQPPSTLQTPGQETQSESTEIKCADQPTSQPATDPKIAIKAEATDSELSDLDDDALDTNMSDGPAPNGPATDDIGEVLPDHWSGTVPVFKPTMEQFKDFKLFMEKVDSYGMTSGIIKIIPPQEWKDAQPELDDLVKQIRVRDPIKQEIMGSGGTYRQVNFVHQRAYTLRQWRDLCEQSEHQPPARRGERRMNRERPKPAPRAKPATTKEKPASPAGPKKRGPGRPPRNKNKGKAAAQEPPRPMTPVSDNQDGGDLEKPKEACTRLDDGQSSTEKDAPIQSIETEDDKTPSARRMGGAPKSKAKTQSTSARRKYSRREGSVMIDEGHFKDFDYRMDVSDFTPERCEELERAYWKTLTYATPLYGADLMGTLFDDRTDIWNLNKLPNLLDVMGTKVPGVNTAYLYMGMWKATFAWHLEDVDLYSINYLHFGAPKQWYSISQADARRFEAAMKSIWPTEAKSCDQFLRHKSFLISPSHLLSHFNIKVNKCVSYPGEFVVTYPYGYHSGYNLGYNCAEAVNFALDTWLPMGKIAKKCDCALAQDSVWVDVYEIERKLRGEETEYEETEIEDEEDEEEDDDPSSLPTPPDTTSPRTKAPSRKRKREIGGPGRQQKAKKIRIKLKTKAEPPCCLCPNDIPEAELLPTEDGKKAHRMCALYLPETYIETVDGEERIMNVSGISKERKDLRCLFCHSKRGACFQCSQKTCARAYHATCGAAAGVFVEEAEVPVFDDDGTEYKEQAFEFSCRFHRTKRDKRWDGDHLESDPAIRKAAKSLKPGDVCQLQYFKGDIFAGIVVENRDNEETLLLDILPKGDRMEVEWKWLLVPDPSDYHLPKASPNALPLPTSRKAKSELNAKRAENEVPRKDAIFAPGYTWAEFVSHEVKNSEQVKIDLSKEANLWHYLGELSTEAKAQYTEDPRVRRHDFKSNYLDTIPKPPKPPKPAAAAQRAKATAAAAQRPYTYTPWTQPVAATHQTNSGSAAHQQPQASAPGMPAPSRLPFGTDPQFSGNNYYATIAQTTQSRFAPVDVGAGHGPAGPHQAMSSNAPTRPPGAVGSTYAHAQPDPVNNQQTSSHQNQPHYRTHSNSSNTQYNTASQHQLYNHYQHHQQQGNTTAHSHGQVAGHQSYPATLHNRAAHQSNSLGTSSQPPQFSTGPPPVPHALPSNPYQSWPNNHHQQQPLSNHPTMTQPSNPNPWRIPDPQPSSSAPAPSPTGYPKQGANEGRPHPYPVSGSTLPVETQNKTSKPSQRQVHTPVPVKQSPVPLPAKYLAVIKGSSTQASTPVQKQDGSGTRGLGSQPPGPNIARAGGSALTAPTPTPSNKAGPLNDEKSDHIPQPLGVNPEQQPPSPPAVLADRPSSRPLISTTPVPVPRIPTVAGSRVRSVSGGAASSGSVQPPSNPSSPAANATVRNGLHLQPPAHSAPTPLPNASRPSSTDPVSGLPEIPADSSVFLEKMVANLHRASEHLPVRATGS